MASIRMIAVVPLTALLAGCGLVEADPNRFERWAEGVAAIPVSAEAVGLRGPILSAQTVGLRGPIEPGSRSPMRIEVVEPEVLWDARADGFAAVAATAVAEAVVEQAVARTPSVVEQAVTSAPLVVGHVVRTAGHTIQLGAFSSRQAAEAAWAQISGHSGLTGVAPLFEEVQRDGRTLVRLKASVDQAHVQDVCRAAGAGAYCASTGRS